MPDTTVVREVKGRIRIDTSDLGRAAVATQVFGKEVSTSLGNSTIYVTQADTAAKKLAATHLTQVVPAHVKTAGSVKAVEESMHHGSIVLGQYGEHWEGLSKRLGGVQGLLTGGLALGVAGVAGAAAVGLVIRGVESAIEVSERADKSYASLHQAAEIAKVDYGQLKAGVESFLQANRRFIGDQFEAVDAMAMFTRGGLDQATATRALGASLDLSALKGISLADAAHIVQLALNGNGRAVRELGIDLKSLTAEQDTSETASVNLAKAQHVAQTAAERLAVAQRALLEFEVGLHAKKTVSELDLLHEEDHKQAVADATQDLAAAQANLAKAQDMANMSSSKQIKVLDEIIQKTEGGRASISKMTQAQNDLNRSRQDFSEKFGPVMAESLAQDIDWFNQAITKAGEFADAINHLPGMPGAPPLPSVPSGGVPGHPQMTVATAHQLGLQTMGELEQGVAAQRATEWTDRLATSVAAAARADQRLAEIADTVTSNLGAQRDESDNLIGRNAALQGAIYDTGVAHNLLTTRIHEVITAQRDESDQFTATGQNSRNQLLQTQAVYDGFVAHINSEHLDAAKLYVDYSQVEEATARWNNLLYNVAVHRGELQANFVVNRIGSQGNLEGLAGGGSAIPGHIYRVGEGGPETLLMGASGGYVIPNDGGGSATPASTTIVEIDSPIILDDREVGRFVKRQISREARGQG